MYRFLIIISVTLMLSCGSGSAETTSQTQEIIAVDTVDVTILGRIDGNNIIIDKDVDVKGCECRIPAGKTLVFKGGMIKNGILNGNMTKIECKGKAFNKVTIKGSWNVPEISTKLFADLSYENSLKDVVALANPMVRNRIVIEKGDYKVKADKRAKTCVPLCSNTEFILKGTIRLDPNDLKHYNIIQVKGENINIKGNGTIIGDKPTHIKKGGEWGMGIRLKGANNTKVSGLTIKDCWGDCIYVGGNSRNVLIEHCKLDHGRRQGISITKANGVTVRNCMITNVGGTAPQYAIDIEPNGQDLIDNILIENNIVKDCKGGFLVYGGLSRDRVHRYKVGRVTIRNCKVSSKNKKAISIRGCEEVKIENNTLYATGRTAISVVKTGKAIVQNNTASIDGSIIEKAKNRAKKVIGKGKEPIHVSTIEPSIIKNNKVIER